MFCHRCGKINASTAKFCKECGTELKVLDDEAENLTNEEKNLNLNNKEALPIGQDVSVTNREVQLPDELIEPAGTDAEKASVLEQQEVVESNAEDRSNKVNKSLVGEDDELVAQDEASNSVDLTVSPTSDNAITAEGEVNRENEEALDSSNLKEGDTELPLEEDTDEDNLGEELDGESPASLKEMIVTFRTDGITAVNVKDLLAFKNIFMICVGLTALIALGYTLYLYIPWVANGGYAASWERIQATGFFSVLEGKTNVYTSEMWNAYDMSIFPKLLGGMCLFLLLLVYIYFFRYAPIVSKMIAFIVICTFCINFGSILYYVYVDSSFDASSNVREFLMLGIAVVVVPLFSRASYKYGLLVIGVFLGTKLLPYLLNILENLLCFALAILLLVIFLVVIAFILGATPGVGGGGGSKDEEPIPDGAKKYARKAETKKKELKRAQKELESAHREVEARRKDQKGGWFISTEEKRKMYKAALGKAKTAEENARSATYAYEKAQRKLERKIEEAKW